MELAMRRSRLIIPALLLAGLPFAPGAAAQDPARGEAVAQRLCSRCHAIGPSGDSPIARAPTFREMVKRYPPQALEEALAEGLVVGHPLMPEFTLEPEEIGALVAYLEELGRAGAQ